MFEIIYITVESILYHAELFDELLFQTVTPSNLNENDNSGVL